MIDIKIIRENPDLVKKNIKKKFQGEKVVLVDKVRKLDEDWRKFKYKEDKLRSDRNRVSENINQAMKAKNTKVAKEYIAEAKAIPGKIEKLQIKRKKLEVEIRKIMYQIPNMIHKSVPVGKDEAKNKTLRKWGKIPKFSFKPKSHADIVENLGLVDTERGAKVAGSRFYYLKDDIVLLNYALQKFTLDFLVKKGYAPIQPPYMLNKESISGAVSFEYFEEAIYKIDKENLYLIGTSEHALAAMYKDEVLDVEKPLKYAAVSSCFRKEAGSHGKDTKGIYRIHRFEKVEQFVFCKPEDEDKMFEEIIKNQEEIFKLLGIPYRIQALCSTEFGGSMSRTYDLEAWFPSQKKYGELGSTSSASDYQARKLNTKYLGDKNKRDYVYTLNGTAMTVQRTICCILENNQLKDGSIKIPKVLQKYMNGKKKIELKK